MNKVFGLLLLLALMCGATVAVLAAETSPPPLPRPRPGQAVQPGPPVQVPGQETDQQRLVRQGFNGDDSLMNNVGNPPPNQYGTTPQNVTLKAEITEKGGDIAHGLIWRIFNTRPDKNGQLTMVAKSELATPTLRLKPGDYVVHVAYGRAQTTDTVSVRGQPLSKQLVLDAGGLKLNALITGDLPIPFNLLHFNVFTAGANEADRTLVANKVSPGDILTLNAGTYHVVSNFGDVNAVVRADLRVEPGKLTDATLYQKAQQVSFKLVSNAGGEAIADIDWVVTDKDGKPVFTETGTFPATVLAEGTYKVTAKRGTKAYERTFKTKPGPPLDIEVVATTPAASPATTAPATTASTRK